MELRWRPSLRWKKMELSGWKSFSVYFGKTKALSQQTTPAPPFDTPDANQIIPKERKTTKTPKHSPFFWNFIVFKKLDFRRGNLVFNCYYVGEPVKASCASCVKHRGIRC